MVPHDDDIEAELTFSATPDATCHLLLEHTLRGKSDRDDFWMADRVTAHAGELSHCPDWLRQGRRNAQCARRDHVDGPRTYVVVEEEPRLGWAVTHTVRLRDLDHWLAKAR